MEKERIRHNFQQKKKKQERKIYFKWLIEIWVFFFFNIVRKLLLSFICEWSGKMSVCCVCVCSNEKSTKFLNLFQLRNNFYIFVYVYVCVSVFVLFVYLSKIIIFFVIISSKKRNKMKTKIIIIDFLYFIYFFFLLI